MVNNVKIPNDERIIKVNAFCMLIPVILMSIGHFEFGFVPVVFSVVGMICLLIYNYKYNSEKKYSLSASRSTLLFLLFSSLYILIATMMGNVSGISTAILIVAFIFLINFNVSTSKEPQKIIMLFLNYFVIFIVLLAAYAIIVRLFGDQFITRINDDLWIQKMNIGSLTITQSASGDSGIGFGVGSITNNPNVLSYLSLFACTIVLFLKKQRIPFIKLLILIGGIMISGSRMVLFMAAILVILAIPFRIYIKNKKIGVMIFMFVFFSLLVSLIVISTMGIDIFDGLYLNGREVMWRAGMENISMFGGGSGYDAVLLNDIYGTNLSMHNAYISMLVNYGVFFSVVFLGYTIYSFFSIRLLEDSDLKVVVLCLMAELCIAGMSEAAFLYVDNFSYLFFYLLFFTFRNAQDVKSLGEKSEY